MAFTVTLPANGDQPKAGQALADFSVQVPLGLSGEGPWYRMELPLSLQLSARRADTEDLRIFDAAGEPQAFALVREQPASPTNVQDNTVHWFPLNDTSETVGSAPSVKVRVSDTGSVVDVTPRASAKGDVQVRRGWLIDTSSINAPLRRLTLDWNSERDGFQRFSIEASDDLQHWQSWGTGQVARLEFAGERVEQRRVNLPSQPARYLRLLWQSPVQAPLLTGVHVFSSKLRGLAPALNWGAPMAGTSSTRGEYVWQLPAQLAVERLRLNIAQPNTLAPVSVFGRGGPNEPWRILQTGLLYRLSQGTQENVDDELRLAGEPLGQIMIKVDERGGGLGSALPTMRVAVRAIEVVFLARGSAPFTLALGNGDVKPGSLALNTLLAANPMPFADMGIARLAGTPMIAGGNNIEPSSAIDWKRMALIAVLMLGVAVLAAMAWSLLNRRVD